MQTIIALWPFVAVLASCVLLKYSCDLFEQGSNYLGRNMPAGIKGATVNAIGSSMPEMMSCVALLFFMNDPALFTVGLGLTAGSAIFNACVIPSLCILFARTDKGGKVDHIELNKASLIRDVFWVLAAEISLISMMHFGYLNLLMGLILNAIYVGYAIHLYIDSRRSGDNVVEEYEEELIEDKGTLVNLCTFNFNALIFKNKSLNTRSAIILLTIAILIITLSSHLLVEGVLGSSQLFGIPDFISGLVLGAAASSIPDLLLSLKDARKGEYEDAVANPLASNTFDTTISVGLPLVAWMLYTGNYHLAIAGEGLSALRWSIVAVTAAVAATLIYKHKRVTKATALGMLCVYIAWAVWVFASFV